MHVQRAELHLLLDNPPILQCSRSLRPVARVCAVNVQDCVCRWVCTYEIKIPPCILDQSN
jgi:hypothetical protein